MRRKYLSLVYRTFLKSLQLLGLKENTEITPLDVGMEWFQLINSVNRFLLSSDISSSWILRTDLGSWLAKSGSAYDHLWKMALNILGAEWAHRVNGNSEDLVALKKRFDLNINQQGNWIRPINLVDHAMQGYSLLYLVQVTNDLRYRKAADQLVESLLMYPRVSDGSLPYTSKSQEVLVDTLAMICPFLARYSNQYGNLEAMRVSVNQLKQFVLNNVDEDTHLPYHGYYADGPKRLGMHAWGRGTGWYMLGLIDTLIEMPKDHPDYSVLLKAYVSAANSLRDFQRNDGHWNWAILHRIDTFDSSTTSFIGYSLMRGMQAGIIDDVYQPVISSALNALVSVTRSNGLLEGSLGECRGLGKYPQSYGPQLWLQGAATAFVALSIGNLRGVPL